MRWSVGVPSPSLFVELIKIAFWYYSKFPLNQTSIVFISHFNYCCLSSHSLPQTQLLSYFPPDPFIHDPSPFPGSSPPTKSILFPSAKNMSIPYYYPLFPISLSVDYSLDIIFLKLIPRYMLLYTRFIILGLSYLTCNIFYFIICLKISWSHCFKSWVLLPCVNVLSFIYSSSSWGTLRLFSLSIMYRLAMSVFLASVSLLGWSILWLYALEWHTWILR